MASGDLVAAERISDDAFFALDARVLPRDLPAQRRDAEHRQRWVERTDRLLVTDPGGAWVAEYDGEVVGFANGFRRERVWVLATFAVRPGLQGAGIGARLLDAATGHGRDCPRWMLSASDDPRAVRRYWRTGFTLHPQLFLRGIVDRSALPAVGRLRPGTADDFAWMDDLDRSLRGGPHGPDHQSLAASCRLVVADDRSGYAYTTDTMLQLLAARDTPTATRLLTECLAGAGEIFTVAHLTQANAWAVDLGMGAGLALSTRGFLGLRGMEPPAPYVHNGALL